ncbi:hypothetical protein SEA_NAIRB_49 [Mycobacterium phage Nairb]|uniref:Uncharacterized protein n=5 Tax=Bernalvirus bernal13 TaxID=1982102 RepID=A0A2P1JRQ9_9CAUD|nr:hypothetical protein FH37_gp49 [Mycobacterium phage Bernal13]AIT13463.1 hypothetical protein PBI_RONRAYGUN_50 [Mycobacterium phage RonRayGun]ASJ79130.1 hypothetical protein SEA_ZENTIME222_49 [Mycobacterium phage ZenTime222]AVO21837.1 hypothetical protein SEA_NAIRB_49 [Mycobacterium phage Nairb]QBP28895.1 hypothetical protein SEA_IBRAHIM_50 [Mycobacterium phage Ibrahim]QHB47454.1 hypothetical protein SEA_WHITTY_49 [Mycobacterium phage Whitty]
MTEFTRPNGKPYRPRKPGLQAHIWSNEAAGLNECGVVVLGTHDIEAARPLALDASRRYLDADGIEAPVRGWFRQGFHYGERRWFFDGDKGRPGVSFTAVVA